MAFRIYYKDENGILHRTDDVFDTRAEAETFTGIEMTQMEFGDGKNALIVKPEPKFSIGDFVDIIGLSKRDRGRISYVYPSASEDSGETVYKVRDLETFVIKSWNESSLKLTEKPPKEWGPSGVGYPRARKTHRNTGHRGFFGHSVEHAENAKKGRLTRRGY